MPIEVAKICFIAGLTFWLGNATVLGLGIIHSPDAAGPIDRMPAWFNRDLGIAMLIVLASYVGWVWSAPRVIGQREWLVRLPNGPLDAGADRHRHCRSRLLRDRHVHVAAE